jgi:cell shape-determining protein MreD
MRIWILCFILLVTILIESTFTTVPITLILLINYLVLEKKSWVFAAAFFAGLALDILSLRFLGSTSLFFVSLLFIINLYERKFETFNVFFILFSSFVASFLYLNIFAIRLVMSQAILSALISCLAFYLLVFSEKESPSYKYKIGEE